MHVERTFTVAQPVEAVFDYLADFTHTNEWDPGTVETTRTSGDGGVGTTYANTSEFMGRRTDLVYETLVHERPARLRFQGSNKSATAHRHDDVRAGRRRDPDDLPRGVRLRPGRQPGRPAPVPAASWRSSPTRWSEQLQRTLAVS